MDDNGGNILLTFLQYVQTKNKMNKINVGNIHKMKFIYFISLFLLHSVETLLERKHNNWSFDMQFQMLKCMLHF